jgi:transposase
MYSIEIRVLVLNIYNKLKNMRSVENITNISKSSICRWLKRIQPKSKQPKYIDNIPVIVDIITFYLKNKDYSTICDIQKIVKSKLKINCSYSLIRLIMIKHMNLSFKKTKYAFFLNQELLKQKIKTFKSDFKNIKNSPLTVFVDEIGFSSNLNPIYSWSIKGKKTYIDIKHDTHNRKINLYVHILLAMAKSNIKFQIYHLQHNCFLILYRLLNFQKRL